MIIFILCLLVFIYLVIGGGTAEFTREVGDVLLWPILFAINIRERLADLKYEWSRK